jgi:hypothetical protein
VPYPTQWADYNPKKFMCCLCFKILDIKDCATVDGERIDVCALCRIEELKTLAYLESQENPPL